MAISPDKLKKRQIIKQIRDQIFSSEQQGRKHFNVFTAEASLGKTRTCEKTLADLWRERPDVKTLFVKLFQESEESETAKRKKDNGFKVENPSYKRINELAGSEIAISCDAAYYMMKVRSIKDKEAREAAKDRIRNAPVLIITHSQYIRLCKLPDNHKRLKFFTEGRTILIIDEELKMLDTYDVSSRSIDKVREYLEQHNYLHIKEKETGKIYNVLDMFNRIVDDFSKYMNDIPNNSIFLLPSTMIEYPPCNPDSVKMAIIGNINSELSRIKDASTEAERTLNAFKKERLDALKDYTNSIFMVWKKAFDFQVSYGCSNGYFYTWIDAVAASRGKLCAYHDMFRFILLENNILLDASAKFNHIYKLQPTLFQLVDHERVVDHSESTIHVNYKNTTKAAKDRNPDFYSSIIRHILNNCNDGDKVLVVGKKDEVNHLKVDIADMLPGATIDFANFQNLRGKNTWKDYNKCYIIHTPNMSYAYYYFLYEMYARIKEQSSVYFPQSYIPLIPGKNMHFKNEELEQVRKTYIASNIYQAIMRVNRDRQHPADIYIINSDHQIVDMVKEQLLNVRFKEFELDITKPQRKPYDNSERHKKSSIGKLVDFLIGDNFGEFTKKELIDRVGCNSRKSFNEKVIQPALNHLEANKYANFTYGDGGILKLDDRTIKLENKKIIITRLESHP